ncbi:saccharopine dehydrogenase NADP-binding domain-containing protein [Saccharopolyspora pogona]|uniref:saccharopine dehydrogenase NADP-binding domain-containing protein n=1 Tax=Saccharopolyspora pogona TaxID=333966 RepID=UPI001CC23C7A|nr:saccharopine dehydrogenase NADP-binding domain-containing protein [Saccharopolyspora pogona]
MNLPMVGVLGASGAVGSAAVAALGEFGGVRLRLGARRVEALSGADVRRVDAEDRESLAEFCAGCDVVLNCAGPTYRLKDAVAVAALSAGAHYIDVAGDDPVLEGLRAKGLLDGDGVAVVSAGTLPGLSSILPRWLAAGFDRPRTLSAHVGGLERCSPVVAVDMMLSLETGGADGAAFGEPLAAWRDGRVRSRALTAREHAEAPHFPGTVALQPILSSESIRLAESLRLSELDWLNVWPGRQTWTLLSSLPSLTAGATPPEQIAERMVRAADLDLAGRQEYYLMVFAMTGLVDGRATERTVVLRAASSYRLTATVGALTVLAVLEGAVPSGGHFACDVLDPAEVVAGLGDVCSIADESDTEEGVL